MISTAARIVARTAAVAVISISALGLAGTAFADEDQNAGDGAEHTSTYEVAPAATPAGDLPEPCTLLPLELAQQIIDSRTELTLTSTSGGAECLYQAADGSGSYAVDLDISQVSTDSLAGARDAWSSPGVEIADTTGLGDGAFAGLNNDIDAFIVCAKDGVQFDLEVWAPEAEFAQQQVKTLAEQYCTPDATPAAAIDGTDAADRAADTTADADTDAETATE